VVSAADWGVADAAGCDGMRGSAVWDDGGDGGEGWYVDHDELTQVGGNWFVVVTKTIGFDFNRGRRVRDAAFVWRKNGTKPLRNTQRNATAVS
jgi:hypothetical protein